MYDTCAHIQNADVGLPYKGLGRVKKTSLLKVVISGHVKTTRLLNILKRGLKWPEMNTKLQLKGIFLTLP